MNNQKEQFKQSPTPIRGRAHIANFLNKSLKSYIEFEEKLADALAKFLTRSFGSLGFLNLTLTFVLLWIIVNLGIVPSINIFDPYPFSWLMIIIQIFAIVLFIIVLISQNQEKRINEVRQQIDFEINVRAEHEITKILHMIEEIHKEIGIAKIDNELEQMKIMTDISEIKEDVERVIKKKDKTGGIT